MVRALYALVAGALLLAMTAGGALPVAAKKKSKKKAGVAVASAQHQVAPSSARYKEIQEALISKGYLEGPSNGIWDQNSMNAMSKFQADQKLEPTGKITARALIDLGLGPKDGSTPNTSAPASTTPTNK
jgi:Putative peptidoglycan binding domain